MGMPNLLNYSLKKCKIYYFVYISECDEREKRRQEIRLLSKAIEKRQIFRTAPSVSAKFREQADELTRKFIFVTC